MKPPLLNQVYERLPVSSALFIVVSPFQTPEKYTRIMSHFLTEGLRKNPSFRFTPGLKFLLYFSVFSLFILSVLGAFGLFQTALLPRFLLSFSYAFAAFLVFGLVLLILRRQIGTWNGKHWLIWLLSSLLFSTPIHLYLHDRMFGYGSASMTHLIEMAYYTIVLFVLAAVSYGLVFHKDKDKIVEKERANAKLIPLRIHAENPKNDFVLPLADFLFAKSAANYIEVHYTAENTLKKKLVRTTLKRLAAQRQSHKEIMQCHQAFVVNITQVKQVKGNAQNRYLMLKETAEPIPVSRRFHKPIQEAFHQLSLNLADYP